MPHGCKAPTKKRAGKTFSASCKKPAFSRIGRKSAEESLKAGEELSGLETYLSSDARRFDPPADHVVYVELYTFVSTWRIILEKDKGSAD